MDGDQTKDTLDALADLFLTGTIPSGSRPVRVPPLKKSSEPLDDDEVAERSADSESIADQLDGPESIRIHSSGSGGSIEPDDEKNVDVTTQQAVALRLRREEDSDGGDDNDFNDAQDGTDDAVAQRALPASRVEALFVGNLPGWSGPWLVQYAHFTAQQRGPVAVLHVDDDQIEIELVTADRTQLDAIDRAVRDENADGLFSLLDVLTFNVEAPVATWMVHLPAPAEPKQKRRAAELFRWTVLTGADDTAVAAGHRLLSQLLQTSNDEDSQAMDAKEAKETAASHRIRAMVMGCDEARSKEAIAKFNDATAELLTHSIERVGHRQAMEPVHAKQYGPYTNDTYWTRVAEYLSELDSSASDSMDSDAGPDTDTRTDTGTDSDPRTEAPAAVTAASRIAPNAPVSVSAEELAALGVTGPVDDSFDDEFDDEFDISAEVDASAAPSTAKQSENQNPKSEIKALRESESAVFDQAEAVASPVRESFSSARTAAPLQMASSAATDSPDLAAMLAESLGGGVTLDAKCPRQHDKQIVLDQQGNLHLLREHVDSDVRGSIVDLIEARDWVSEHIELLALTQRDSQFNPNSEPTLHLFADDAKAAVAMVNKLGPSVKLHLVLRVNVGDQATWVCTDLN